MSAAKEPFQDSLRTLSNSGQHVLNSQPESNQPSGPTPPSLSQDDAPRLVDTTSKPPTESGGDGARPTTEDHPIEPAASMQRLSDQFVPLERLLGYIIGGVVLLGVVCGSGITALFTVSSWPVFAGIVGGWCLLAGILLYFAHFHPRRVYNHTHWMMSDEGFEIRRGIIWRHRIAIPAARVQHIDVSQGPMQRMYDLSTITIHTAGTKNASVELNGLNHSVAMAARDKMIQQKELLDDRSA